VTLSVAALVLFIDPMAVETRLGVAITGLLTLVLMGLGFQEKIPDVAQLTGKSNAHNKVQHSQI